MEVPGEMLIMEQLARESLQTQLQAQESQLHQMAVPAEVVSINNMNNQMNNLGSPQISNFSPSNETPSEGEDENGGLRGRKRSSELKICMALGCDRQIKRRRLCSTHQKQKERNHGQLALKDDFKEQKFTKGRSPTPFSKHANKYAKLKQFDAKIDQWAGGKEEGTSMLQEYIRSTYYQARYPKREDSSVFEQIGKNMVSFLQQLPEKSPLRKPLIKAISENLAPSRLSAVLPISKRTIMYSKKIPDNDNLLLTIRYKPTPRRREDGSIDLNDNGLDDMRDGNDDQLEDLTNINNYNENDQGMGVVQAMGVNDQGMNGMDQEVVNSEEGTAQYPVSVQMPVQMSVGHQYQTSA